VSNKTDKHNIGNKVAFWAAFRLTFSKGTIGAVLLSYCCAIGIILWYVRRNQQDLTNKTALENAKLYSQALAEFRTLYTREVVSRVRKMGIEVTHDYDKKKHAIPLPATLSMMLGREIGKQRAGAQTRLYSAYPFPWRKEGGGLQDDFGKAAWKSLKENPGEPYFRFVKYEGRSSLRYATADLMRPACVNCHNTHPDTPKNDWKSGDVRGILEIIHPMDSVEEQTAAGMRGTFFLILGLTILGTGALGFVVVRLRQSVEDRTRALETLGAAHHELKVTQQRLVQTGRLAAVGQLAAGVAHEINNPLCGVLGHARNIELYVEKHQYDQQEPVKFIVERVNKITRDGLRCKKIIENLLSFSREGNVQMLPIKLESVIKTTLELLGVQLRAASITLETQFDEALPRVHASATALQQVFTNLLLNAQQATPAGGQVFIRTGLSPDGFVEVKFQDTGEGIPQENIERLFDPFFTTKAPGEGTGLGLSISHKIIQDHRGEILVESVLGGGSTFTVRLPSSEQQGGWDR